MAGFADAYSRARKLGAACFEKRKQEGLDPYLPVMDTAIEGLSIRKTRSLGIREIPTDSIIGTVHKGRTESFAWNFMPILADGSEFAAKWGALYKALEEEGLREPVKVYELFGRYFVEEGNKRVSVTRYMENPLIEAQVTRIIVDASSRPGAELYEEYLKFAECTGVYSIIMSKRKNYTRLLKLLNCSSKEPLSAKSSDELISLFNYVDKAYHELLDGETLRANSSDALLIFLEVYGWDPSQELLYPTVLKELEKIWPDVAAWPDKNEAALVSTPELPEHKKLFSLFQEPVRTVFIESQTPETSSWTAEHDKGIAYLKEQLGSAVEIRIIHNCNTEKETEAALEEAVAWKAGVVFTTNPFMLQISNIFAARYPKIKFLNCSLNPDSGTLRTYFPRSFEVRFLMGLAAGMLTRSGHIGFIADYPIYGTIAEINAFALGVMMTRPRARVYLDWSTTTSATLTDSPLDVDLFYASGQEFDPRVQKGKKFGLFNVGEGRFFNLATLEVHWGVFYVRILKSVLNNTYRDEEIKHNTESINYWLGFSNGLLSIHFSSELPFQSRRLIEMFQEQMRQSEFFIFQGSPDGGNGLTETPLDLEQILKMNWLVSNVEGIIPKEKELIPEADMIVKVHAPEVVRDDSDDEADEPETEALA